MWSNGWHITLPHVTSPNITLPQRQFAPASLRPILITILNHMVGLVAYILFVHYFYFICPLKLRRFFVPYFDFFCPL